MSVSLVRERHAATGSPSGVVWKNKGYLRVFDAHFTAIVFLQYGCVDVSANFIALGANTGGVYWFHKDCRYIQLLANKVCRA